MDEITPADNLKGFFVRARSGEIALVVTDERYHRNGGRLLLVQRCIGDRVVPETPIVPLDTAYVEVIKTTAELASTSAAQY